MADTDDKPSAPRWRQDFPILWDEDHYVMRRELAKFLTLGSGLLVGATLAVGVAGGRLRSQGAWPRLRVGGADTLARGASVQFRYPTDEDPCIAVRLQDGKLVAWSQICTHLSCAVVHRPGAKELYCPCHEGAFDCADGRPTAGPPQRRLPRIRIEEAADGIYAVGVEV